MTRILFSGTEQNWNTYRELIPEALEAKGITAEFLRDMPPEDVEYMVYSPMGPVQDFSPYTNLKAVLSLWAGVESIVGNSSLTAPLCRMVDEGLRQGMAEWVTGHCLRYHLGMDAQIVNPDHLWREDSAPPLAQKRHIGILGLGELGQACAEMLGGIGFEVAGWSRSAKEVAGIHCYWGEGGLEDILARSDILVLLLPQTPETTHIINAKTLAMMPNGARILNPGRGPLIRDKDLLLAMDSGHIAHATLDVFATEPLPADHPYWTHARVTVTPHIASQTRPETAAKVIAQNVARGEGGEAFLYLVDRRVGY